MATVTSTRETVNVSINLAELTALLIQPAKDAGFIDFDPTRVDIKKEPSGDYIITFEKVTGT